MMFSVCKAPAIVKNALSTDPEGPTNATISTLFISKVRIFNRFNCKITTPK